MHANRATTCLLAAMLLGGCATTSAARAPASAGDASATASDATAGTVTASAPEAARSAPTSEPAAPRDEIESVVVHPIFATWFVTTEHWEGQLGSLGDALGADCVVSELVEEDGRTWLRQYRGDGSRNEDWYGWSTEVLAPIDGEVVRVNVNPTTNSPGSFTPGLASFVVLRRDDGTHVLVAHLREIRVVEGDRVRAGQPLGLVGNNGNSRHPHIHLGAWRDERPLQLRFDLRAMAALRQRLQQQHAEQQRDASTQAD